MLPADVVARSEAFGQAIASHILAWSRDDGGAVVENMGFPLEYTLTQGPAHWVPTSLIAQQQFPLLPKWGDNRTFAMPKGATCIVAGPARTTAKTNPRRSTRMPLEVYETGQIAHAASRSRSRASGRTTRC